MLILLKRCLFILILTLIIFPCVSEKAQASTQETKEAVQQTKEASQETQILDTAYTLGIIASSEVFNLSNTIIDSINLLNDETFQKEHGLDKPIIFANEMLPSFIVNQSFELDIITQSTELQANPDIDLILVVGINAVRVVLQHNKGKKPIFLISEHDLVENKVIESYEDSGYDNVTAFIKYIDLIARFSNITQLLDYTNIGMIVLENPDSTSQIFAKRLQERLQTKNFSLQKFTIKEDTEQAILHLIPQIIEAKPDVLVITGIQSFEKNYKAWNFFAPLIKADIPCISPNLRSLVSQGALLSFSMSETQKCQILASTMAKLLAGKNPRELNMVHPYYAELCLNMIIANELELFLPYEFLAGCQHFFYSIDTGI